MRTINTIYKELIIAAVIIGTVVFLCNVALFKYAEKNNIIEVLERKLETQIENRDFLEEELYKCQANSI